MKIFNLHSREIASPIDEVTKIILTLAGPNDKFWPGDKWPRMRMSQEISEGSKCGHGPIRYTVSRFDPEGSIRFEFSKPEGFNGYHEFVWNAIDDGSMTLIQHKISMNTNFPATLKWSLAIRWLHDALIEDAFDKIENGLTGKKKRSSWSPLVKFLRWILG